MAVLLGLVAFSLLRSPLSQEFRVFTQKSETIRTFSLSISHIYVNANFSETAAMYGWCSGNGTAEDPYIIQNLTVDGTYNYLCVQIKNTIDFFKIRNCTILHSKYDGISLVNTGNGTLENNTIHNNNCNGISLSNSKNITIKNNIIYRNGDYLVQYSGIYLTQSNNNSIINNDISYNGRGGIQLYNSNYNNLTSNIVYNSLYGISVSSSNYNRIIHNILLNNFDSTVDPYESVGNVIQNNIQQTKWMPAFFGVVPLWFMIIGGWSITVVALNKGIKQRRLKDIFPP